MPFTVMALSIRGSGFTPKEFRQINERIYIPLLQRKAGALFPYKYIRRYIRRHFQGNFPLETSNVAWPADVRAGSPEEFSSDLYTEMEFPDENVFVRFYQEAVQESIQEMRSGDDSRGPFRQWPEERYLVIDTQED